MSDESNLAVIGGCVYRGGLATTFTDASTGWQCRIGVGRMRHAEGVIGEIAFGRNSVAGKLEPTGDKGEHVGVGSIVENRAYTLSLGGSDLHRHGMLGTPSFHIFTKSSTHLGITWLRGQQPIRDNNGTIERWESVATKLLRVDGDNLWGIEFQPSVGWSFMGYLGYATGTNMLLTDTHPKFAPLNIDLVAGLFVGWMGNSSDTDTTTDLAKFLYSYGRHLLQILAIYMQRQRIQQPTGDWGAACKEVNGSACPAVGGGATADVAPLQMFAALSHSSADTLALFADAGERERIALLILTAIEAVALTVSAGTPTSGDEALWGAGLGAAVQLLEMELMREGIPDVWIWGSQKIIGITLLALAALLHGTAEEGATQMTIAGGIAMAGMQTSLNADRRPGLREKDLVQGTTYRYTPFTRLKHGDATGNRAAFEIDRALKIGIGDGHLHSILRAASPAVYLRNVGTRVANEFRSEEQPLAGDALPSTLSSITKVEWSSDQRKSVFVKGGIGAGLVAQFDGTESHVGAEVDASIDLGINLSHSVALLLGVEGRAAVTDDGRELELGFPRAALMIRGF